MRYYSNQRVSPAAHRLRVSTHLNASTRWPTEIEAEQFEAKSDQQAIQKRTQRAHSSQISKRGIERCGNFIK